MVRNSNLLALLIVVLSSQPSSSFSIPSLSSNSKASFLSSRRSHFKSSSQLQEVITGTKDEDLIDEGGGGVRLASDTAIKISGSNRNPNSKKLGGGLPEANMLRRYSKLTEVAVETVDNDPRVTVIGRGTGNELYQDPGKTLEKIIVYAPSAAVTEAVSSILSEAAACASLSSAPKLVVNFLGGDDLKTLEVMDAVANLMEALEESVDPSKVIIDFHSVSFGTFSEEVCTVTVVAVGNEKEADDASGSDRTSLEKSVAEGEVYFHSGKWYTMDESDLDLSN